VEDFSGGFGRKKLAGRKGEWGQSLGVRRRTERSLLSDRESGTNFLSGGIMTIDPVCGMRVEEKKTPQLQTQFAGKKYFFCSEECRKEFEADPNGYVETAAA
jgi:YHS domain-containing protein